MMFSRQICFYFLVFILLGLVSADSSSTVSSSSSSSLSSSASTGASTTTSADSSTSSTATSKSSITSSVSSTTKTTTSAVRITASNSLNDGSSSIAIPTYSSSKTTTTTAYPTPTIPVTDNNPFLKESSAPDGTVFIAVGAILGGIALAVLAWRALVAYSLHRSLKNAHAVYGSYDSKPKAAKSSTRLFGPSKNAGSTSLSRPVSTVYSRDPATSEVSLDQLTSSGRTLNTARPKSAYESLSAPSTFYSPTAHAIGMSARNSNLNAPIFTSGNRSSTYLPAGFYGGSSASGLDTPNRNSTVQPNSRANSPARYTTSASLLTPPQPGQRAASAYLDSLLDSNPDRNSQILE
ncbi:uncharacterized protein V1516DRAFT_668718 [Lipomyces oligophaga]|uniref:uncharacterized protein n=1 Tax=Lipomyces oligophaga TaxID=45792 RepID=UPI0034CDF08E